MPSIATVQLRLMVYFLTYFYTATGCIPPPPLRYIDAVRTSQEAQYISVLQPGTLTTEAVTANNAFVKNVYGCRTSFCLVDIKVNI
jgi:hypothetical protein